MPCPSSRDVAVPGKAQSSRKHHPFLAMAAAAAQSAKAAKKRPHSLDGDEGIKQAHKKLPSIPLRKKISTGGVKRASSLLTRHSGIMRNSQVSKEHRFIM